MQQIVQDLSLVRQDVAAALTKLHASDLQAELAELQQRMQAAGFWQDNQKAQVVAQREAKLRAQLEPWLALQKEVDELHELANSGDVELADELSGQLAQVKRRLNGLKRELLFNGKYDGHDAILRLSAGAGGTDAQDWTEMLARMYSRWAEAHGMKTEVLEQSAGEEAGLKSMVMSVSGPYAYGKLQGEHGVHRLVRLSPFNADNLRQTSFAMVEVLPQIDAPDEVAIDDKDLKVDVFRAGGHGGQSVNTTDSAVRVTHVPTGITVSIQNERSQLQNKDVAMRVLRSKLAQLQVEQHRERLDELRGPAVSAEWGNQIRNYVLHPYTMVKDTRTRHEERDARGVLDGKLDGFIGAFLESE